MNETVQVLLVDDDDIDVEAIERAFKKEKISNPIRRAVDGVEALEILRGENGRQRLRKPYIILLDINMPRMNGFEFLDAIRKDPSLSDSVVFMLSTSRNEMDLIKAYSEHVAGYICKAEVGPSFKKMLDMLKNYWMVVKFQE